MPLFITSLQFETHIYTYIINIYLHYLLVSWRGTIKHDVRPAWWLLCLFAVMIKIVSTHFNLVKCVDMCWHQAVSTPDVCVCCHWIKPAAYRRPRPGIWPRCVSNKESYSHGQLHLAALYDLDGTTFAFWTSEGLVSHCHMKSHFNMLQKLRSFLSIHVWWWLFLFSMHYACWTMNIYEYSSWVRWERLNWGPLCPKGHRLLFVFRTQKPSERSGQLSARPSDTTRTRPSLMVTTCGSTAGAILKFRPRARKAARTDGTDAERSVASKADAKDVRCQRETLRLLKIIDPNWSNQKNYRDGGI